MRRQSVYANSGDPFLDEVLNEAIVQNDAVEFARTLKSMHGCERVIDEAVAILEDRHRTYLDIMASVREQLAGGSLSPDGQLALGDLMLGLAGMGELELSRKVAEVGALIQTPAVNEVAS